MTRYTRQDVLRILHLGTRQLLAWERAGLIESFPDHAPAYSFAHLAQARKLRELRAKAGARRVSLGSLRASLDALEKGSGMTEGWMDAGHTGSTQGVAEVAWRRRGRRAARTRECGAMTAAVSPRQGDARMHAGTRQMAFDFLLDGEALDGELKVVNAGPLRVGGGRLFAIPRRGAAAGGPVHPASPQGQAAQVQEMFLRAVRLEETPSTVKDAAELYQAILCIKPDHAPASINLGTIYYNQREFAQAEGMYRRATEADPGYALAFFDLGNVLDEMQRLGEAIDAYREAITLLPGYADAHYNLALAYERQGERRRALRHWTTYTRLDPIGPWSQHARGQARKILAMERLSIVSRSGRSVAAAG